MAFFDWFSSALKNPYASAGLVLAATVLIGLVVRLFTRKILVRMVRATRTDWDDRIVTHVQSPIFLTIVLSGMSYAVSLLPVSGTLFLVILRIYKTLLIFIWTFAGLRITSFTIDWMAEKDSDAPFFQARIRPLLHMSVKGLLVGASAYLLFKAWNADISAWLASAGIFGIAVGFAARDTLANLFSGVFILADAPYKIGDYVNLSDGQRGRVTHIGLRSTRILTRDHVEIILPNAVIGNGMIINESGGPGENFRLQVPVGVAYGSDVDQVRELLSQIAADEAMVEAHPEPRVRFREMADSSLNFHLLVWVDRPELRGRVLDRLNTAIYKKLREHGIEIPHPKRDVTVTMTPTPPTPSEPSRGE